MRAVPLANPKSITISGEKCVRCDDGSRGCNIHHSVVFNCGQPLHNGAPAGILVKGDDNRVWDSTIFNVSSGQGELVAITEFGQNRHSEFFNVAARRIDTRHGLPLSNASSCAFAGGLVTGDAPLLLEDAPRFDFRPTSRSPLFQSGVKHPPELGPHPNVGAYQPGDSWRPGCTFHPRCGLGGKTDDAAAWGEHGRYETVQACVDAVASHSEGGTCSLRAGVHREAITIPPTRRGVVRIVGGDNVTLSGTTVITGEWVRQGSSRVYTVDLPRGVTTDQVFVNGEMAFESRWPNTNLTSVVSEAAWGVSTNSSAPSLLNPDELGYVKDPALAGLGINLAGALLTLQAGTRVWTWTRRVTSHDNDTVYYVGGLMPEKGKASDLRILYTLSDLPGLLDSDNEWFLDRRSSRLSLRVNGGGSPAAHVVEIKRRPLCLSAPAADGRRVPPPVHVENLNMHGCTFSLQSCFGCTVRNISAAYPSHAREVPFRNFPRPTGPPIAVTTLAGNDSSIEGLSLRHSSVTGLLMIGSRNSAREVLVENSNWFGSLDFPAIQLGFQRMLCDYRNASQFSPAHCGHDLAATAASSAPDTRLAARGPGGESNVITRVTVSKTGGGGIVTSQLANEISYARVVDGQLIGLDQAGVHADNLGAHGFPQNPGPPLCAAPGGATGGGNCSKFWHHNWVFRQREKCVRGDDGTVDLRVHHSVIFDCGVGPPNMFAPRASPCGAMFKGDRNAYWANTVWNTRGQGDLVVDTRHGPPCTESGCVPENAHSVFLNSAQRRIATKGRGWRNGSFAGSVGVVGGLVHAANVSVMRLHDPERLQFWPVAGSPLLGAGVRHAPFVMGGHPDVGAYQAGDRWVAGCTFFRGCDAR